MTLLQFFKNVLIVPAIKRKIEVLINLVFGRLLLALLGVYKISYKYKRQTNKTPNIIFSNQSSVIDWIYLLYTYSPYFLWTVKSNSSEEVTYDHLTLQDYYIKLSYRQLFSYSIGLKFLNTNQVKMTKFDILNHFKNTPHIPLCIFPEV